MTVAELIAKLQTLPQDLPVEINDNGNGEVYQLEGVILFNEAALCEEDGDYPVVILQVNC